MAENTGKGPPATVRDTAVGTAPPTKRDTGGTTPATTRDQPGDGNGDDTRSLTNLPSALRADYRIVEELGTSGAEADLLLVEHEEDGTRHVAKIYRSQITLDEETIKRVQGAAREHVVTIESYGRSDGRWYELLEYIEAGSLADLIAHEGPRLDEALVGEILGELAPAIAHLHGLDIVHRDIKPANVLVRTRSQLDLVLADFGLAAVAEQSIVFMSASRTAAYAAPEAASGSVSTARDYWSLGMIVLEALTGRHPFSGLSQTVIDSQLATRPVDLTLVEDERWLLLCQGLLTRDPDLRWGADELDRWLAGESPEVAFEAAPAPRARQPYAIGASRAETRQELATALADNWTEARDRIGRDQFLPWFEQYWPDTNLAADAHRVLNPDGATKGKGLANAEVKLYRLIHLLDPSVAPRFRTVTLDTAGLRSLTDHAARGDKLQVAIVQALRDLDLLTALGEATPTNLAEIATRWSGWRDELRTAATAAKTAGAPTVAANVLDQADVQLLHYAANPELVEPLRRKAVEASSPDANAQTWFTSIGDPANADAPRLILLLSLASEAERQTTEQRAAAEAERQRQLAAALAAAREDQRHRRRVAAWGGWWGAVAGSLLGLAPAFIYGQIRNQVIDRDAVLSGGRALADVVNPAEVGGWLIVSIGLGLAGGLLVATARPYLEATRASSGTRFCIDVTVAAVVTTAIGYAVRLLLDQGLAAEIFDVASGQKASTYGDDFWADKAQGTLDMLVRNEGTVAWLTFGVALIALCCLLGYLYSSATPAWARWSALTFGLVALFPYLLAPVAVLAVGVGYVILAVLAIALVVVVAVVILMIVAGS